VVDAELEALGDFLLLLLPPQPVIANPTASSNATINPVRVMGASSSLGYSMSRRGRLAGGPGRTPARIAACRSRATASRAISGTVLHVAAVQTETDVLSAFIAKHEAVNGADLARPGGDSNLVFSF
jgi:hypothetical protein